VLENIKNALNVLGETSLFCIQSVLYVLKPANRADFSMISGFVNFLMEDPSNAGSLSVVAVER